MTLSAAVRGLVALVIASVVLFACAGRVDLPFFWAYLGLVTVAGAAVLASMDPGLVQERIRPGPGGVDRTLRFTAMPFFFAVFVLAGLDARFGWSHVPAAVRVIALVFIAGGYSVSAWTIRNNRFFSPVVRIQAERGHVLVTSGPYAHVRHPGYAATLVVLLATGLALGSWWALLPGVGVAPLIFRRIWIEERYLRANLPGYEEYAGRVRWRLVVGVW